MLVLEEGGEEKVVDLSSDIGQFFTYSTKCVLVSEDSENSSELSEGQNICPWALREGLRKHCGCSEEGSWEDGLKEEVFEPHGD